MTDQEDIRDYYARRACEYEEVYAKPERQEDLATLRELLPRWLAGHSVLEIACGTGYWTEMIAKTARSVLAVDISEEVLAIARRKNYGQSRVAFRQADAYSLGEIEGTFSAGFVGFWWSHIPRSRRRSFLETLHARLSPGAVGVLVDNRYVHGSSSPLAPTTDEHGNTYSLRRLSDGSEWRVLKNFPAEAEVRQDLSLVAEDIEYGALKYYWWVKYAAFTSTPPVRKRRPGQTSA